MYTYLKMEESKIEKDNQDSIPEKKEELGNLNEEKKESEIIEHKEEEDKEHKKEKIYESKEKHHDETPKYPEEKQINEKHKTKFHSKEKKHDEVHEHKKIHWHDRHYKNLLLLPLAIILASIIYLFVFYQANGDFFKKDISLTGGTSVTLYDKLDAKKLELDLSSRLEEVGVRDVYDIITREQKAIVIQTKSDGELTKKILEDYLGYGLTEENSSFEFTGSSLSESFYKQLLTALLIAFLLMAIVVFLIFRTFIPSTAVIVSAFADIVMTIVFINFLGIKISSAGIVAILMLIGYSIDTDILLTNRVLKGASGSLNEKLYGAFKTGITMTLTAIAAVGISLIITSSFSPVLGQIFTIILIGLSFDIFNTWITNVSILKWYVLSKEKKNEA